jgi:dTDP-4-dehydrorhamnose reductase
MAVDFPEIDLADVGAARRLVREARPEIIVNAAAYTAVDRAESEPDQAMAVNGIAPGILAEEARALGACLVHFSTDYVFDGEKRDPYVETDRPNPLNVYGKTKLAGEQAIRDVGGAHLILRTSWVYGARGHNFLLTIRRLAREREALRVVGDQVGSPTWCRFLAEATTQIIRSLLERGSDATALGMREGYGVYNLSAEGQTSWRGFAKAILETDPARTDILAREVVAITSAEHPTLARRPRNSVLSKQKVRNAFGLEVPSWEEQLARCWEAMIKEAGTLAPG